MSIFRKTSFVFLFMGAAFVTFVGRSALKEGSSYSEDESAAAKVRLQRWTFLSSESSSGEESDPSAPASPQKIPVILTKKNKISHQSGSSAPFQDHEGRWCVKQSGEQKDWGSAKKIPSLSSSKGVVFFLNPVHVKY